MFIAGILVFLVGVAITIITPDTIALGLTLLIAGVVLVSLSGARRHGAEPHIDLPWVSRTPNIGMSPRNGVRDGQEGRVSA